MNKYNPNRAPDPEDWKALDEFESRRLIEQYHIRKRIPLENVTLHAVFHVIVENQIAMGDEMNVAKTLQRLMNLGLNRHEALHAITFVLSKHMRSLFGKTNSEFDESQYKADLEKLTPESWIEMAEFEG